MHSARHSPPRGHSPAFLVFLGQLQLHQPGPLGHHRDLAGDDLRVVAGQDSAQTRHCDVGDLDRLSVKDLVQGVGGRKTGVHQVEELPPDIRGHGVAPGRPMTNSSPNLSPDYTKLIPPLCGSHGLNA